MGTALNKFEWRELIEENDAFSIKSSPNPKAKWTFIKLSDFGQFMREDLYEEVIQVWRELDEYEGK